MLRGFPSTGRRPKTRPSDVEGERWLVAVTEDVFSLMDEWGPDKVVCVSDRRSGMRGVLVLDNTARGMGKGGTRMSPRRSPCARSRGSPAP